MIGTFDTIKKKVHGSLKTEGLVRKFLHLSDVLYEKDSYTFRHCSRVALYCSLMGNSMGLSEEKMESLITGAFFHDLGKIAVPKEILQKPGALSGREWDIIRIHPVASAKLLEAAGCPDEAVSAMLHHHESYDGTGYPQGLKGDEIPLLSRIVSVADAYDSMTTTRCYSGIFRNDKAIKELHACKWSQFDPEIVDVFTDIVRLPYIEFEAI